MLEELLAAEVLEVRVLHPAIAQSLVGKVIRCLRIASPAISRVGNGGWPGLSVYTAPSFSSRKTPVDRPRQLHRAWVMSMIWSSRERNRSCSPPSRRSRGRIANLPLHQFEREESRLGRFEGILKIQFARKSPLQRSKTGKFDYFRTPNQPARSRDSEFFTDDLTRMGAFGGGNHLRSGTLGQRMIVRRVLPLQF